MDKYDSGHEPTEAELDELNEHWHEPGDPDGVFAAEQQQKWQATQPQVAPVPPARPRRKRRWLRLLIVLLLIAAAGVAAYWLGAHQAASTHHRANAPAKQPVKQPAQQTSTTQTATKHYDSSSLTLGFDYPADWQVAETAAALTVTSPKQQLQTADGQQAAGQVRVTFRKQQKNLSEFSAGPATAVLESQKLTYKQPTAIQRAQTYLSFLGYAGSRVSGLDALYITGDNGYQQDQSVPMSDIVKSDPLISVTFFSCSNTPCTLAHMTPLTLDASSWQHASFTQPVIALLESLTLD